MPELDPVLQAELSVAETIGQLMQFWGFKRPMGRLWTVLFLSPEALGAAELGERLRMSAGAISMNLNELLKWGAIRRTWRPGERRDYFECEVSVWKLVRRVLRERELTLVREAKDVLDRALESLQETQGPALEESTLSFKKERIATLRRLAGVGELLLTALDAGAPVDPSRIQSVIAASLVDEHDQERQ